MLQFGNLAMVCAGRPDVSLTIAGGEVNLFVGDGPGRRQIAVDWKDNGEVNHLIYELNHGALQRSKPV